VVNKLVYLISISVLLLNKAAATAPLQFLALGATPGVTRIFLPKIDDGFSSAITITKGFLFGFTTETVVYVSIQLIC